MEDDELTQLTLMDPGYAHREAELWEREKRQTKVGRPRKGEERRKPADDAGDEGSVSGPGGRMRGATPGGRGKRGGRGVSDQVATADVEELTSRRVARSAVVAALRRALGRVRDPERWTPLHLAASKKEHQTDLCWWGRWPAPDSPQAAKWSVDGAIIATTPDRYTQSLASAAVRGVGEIERSDGHAATLQFVQERIEQVGRIAAEYVTRADILNGTARLPTAGQGREDE